LNTKTVSLKKKNKKARKRVESMDGGSTKRQKVKSKKCNCVRFKKHRPDHQKQRGEKEARRGEGGSEKKGGG